MDAPYHELLLAAAGSELGFNSLMQRFSSMLYSHAYGILGNKEMAEEVVSDVFFETWKRRKQLVEFDNVRSWLCRVVHRKAIDYLLVWIILACKISCFLRCARPATHSSRTRS